MRAPSHRTQVTFTDYSIPRSAYHEEDVPGGDVVSEELRVIPKPLFRPVYDPKQRGVLGVSITRKTSSVTRLPLSSLHENRMFRFVFVVHLRFDGLGPTPGAWARVGGRPHGL
jgi:hypothetical protein